MKKLFVVFTLLLAGVVFAFFADRSVSAQGSCSGPIYCTGPCNTLWYPPNNCGCSAVFCGFYDSCWPDWCIAHDKDVDPHGCCYDVWDCSSTTETFTCPGYINPCINICGGPTPTPGPAPTPTPAPPSPSCTVDLNPVTASISVGASTDYIASVVPSNGTVDQVNFSSSDTGVATVDPASDATAAYQTSATGVSIGSSTITSDVVMSGVVRCTDT